MKNKILIAASSVVLVVALGLLSIKYPDVFFPKYSLYNVVRYLIYKN